MINVFNHDDGGWAVWTDPDGGSQEGRCVGYGATKARALRDASDKLIADLNRVRQLQECASRKKKKPSHAN